MGIFDLPAPAFSAADRLMASMMPRWSIPLVWGVVAASIASWLYYKLSPQARIDQLKHEAEEARAAMLAYDGDFDGLLPLARRTLALSGQRLFLSIGPALAASLPALFLFTYLDNAYGYREPAPGAPVAVRVEPARVPVVWSVAAAAHQADGTWTLRWPPQESPVHLACANGPELVSFPLRRPVPIVTKFGWWNFLFGNPAGYLPADAPVESVEASLPQAQFLGVGPEWIRGWETLFFLSAAIVALVIKVVFKLH
jgi:hypothetical protein